MAAVDVNGLDVQFPFQPYSCQQEYMEKVLQCLRERENGILESPTGTGKTLSLLCTSLAWQQDLKRTRTLAGAADLSDELLTQSSGHGVRRNVPVIIYSSRTHSQLSQVIQELKSTTYRPCVSILGSRDQLCIHSQVMKASSNTEKIYQCRMKMQSRTCQFYNNMENRGRAMIKQLSEHVLDIEDLVLEGSRNCVCPYFLAREMNSEADVIFMPYHYILDIKTRRTHGIELKNNVVIFDEAHNIEGMCEDSASVELTSYDIMQCIEDVNRCIDIHRNTKDDLPSKSGDLVVVGNDLKTTGNDLERMFCVKSILLAIEKHLDSISITATDGITKPGSFMQEMLFECQVKSDNYLLVLEECDKMLLRLTSDARVSNGSVALQKFSDFLRTVFSASRESFSCYKVHISLRNLDWTNRKRVNAWTEKGFETVRVLSYWCFSPGHAMEDLKRQGVHCIILTSGTLSPLSSFSSELKIPFPITIENPHVIEKHQLLCGTLPIGPGNVTLNSSYRTRFDRSYVNSLGDAVLGFSQIIPQGLLVFFTSYSFMYHCVKTWQETYIWTRLSSIKPIFIEPKGKGEFTQTMKAYYEKICDPEHNAAVFFAICRGKVAEGLDFADMNGRAVIITGLPFPPRVEPKVQLKMQYLDEQAKADESKTDKTRGEKLNGNMWYQQQAFRAVNQAIGRVIRHKNDFGAILLCDTRFASLEAIGRLPKWVRSVTKVYRKYEDLQQQLVAFFKHTEKVMLPPKMKAVKRSTSSMPFAETNSELISLEDGRASKYKTSILFRPSRSKQEASKKKPLQQDGSFHFKPAQEVEEHVPTRSCDYRVYYEKVPASSSTNRRRLRVVRLPSRTTNDAQQDIKDDNVQTPGRSKRDKQKVVDAHAYLEQVRSVLCLSSFRTFKALVASYQKEGNIVSLADGLQDVFRQLPEHRQLVHGIRKFLRPSHKQLFGSLIGDEDGLEAKLSADDICSRAPVAGASAAVTEVIDTETGEHNMNGDGRGTIAARDGEVEMCKSTDSAEPVCSLSPVISVGSSHCSVAPAIPARMQTQRGRFCMICNGKLRSPFESPCGHLCCFVCWKSSLKVAKKCPVCKAPVRSRQLKKKSFF
ncbi:regulator of telomere elongation helicase 1-like [Corticium candelabrum]|uniref:regulator of telomere elongation helicase 1-like n=1 Tax=Corticium candelabrum TaxID=121492 RepID=UPI002E254406|nr:regulator of telomere elongation helicase 1-like [Corticium candelabrum]